MIGPFFIVYDLIRTMPCFTPLEPPRKQPRTMVGNFGAINHGTVCEQHERPAVRVQPCWTRARTSPCIVEPGTPDLHRHPIQQWRLPSQSSLFFAVFPPSEVPRGLTLLGLQSRFGDKLLRIWLVYPHNGTAAVEGLRPRFSLPVFFSFLKIDFVGETYSPSGEERQKKMTFSLAELR